jgi:hypothetical protein
MATDTWFNSPNAFVYIRGSYGSKKIARSRWYVHLRFGRHPPKQAFSTVFDSYICTSGTLQSHIFGRNFILPMHSRDNQIESSEDSQSRQ